MKHNIFFGSILIGTVFIYSCTQESLLVSTIDEKEITQLKESHFVSLEEALQIAEFQNNPHAKGSVINEYLEYQNNGDLAEFYIINYPNSGFIIISGDDRLTPILAYSENSPFPLCDSIIPWGVTDWLNTTSALIDSIRNTEMEQDDISKYNWKSVLSGKYPVFEPNLCSTKTDYSSYVWEYGEDYDFDDCGYDGQVIAEYYIYVPPLLATKWGQEDGYNEMIEYGYCQTTENGKYPVGCIAVAVGQVMLENRYPTSGFDWDAIYNNGNAYGTATNTFLRDLGLPANLNMNYYCNFSYTTESAAKSYLVSVGYTNTTVTSSISPTIILSDLRYGYPLLLNASNHMWVCEGIKSYHKVTCFAAGGCYDTSDEINSVKQYLYMNWGWYGDYNGWFLNGSSWYANGSNHNSNKRLVYNIEP